MKNIYSQEADVFTSLANPKRLEILNLLEHRELSVNEIVEMTSIPQATVSQHLAVFRRLGLVSTKKEAQTRVYKLVSHHISNACESIRKALHDGCGVHIDPVCGMQLSSHNAACSLMYEKQRYYFCGDGCKEKFESKVVLKQNVGFVIPA